MSTPDTDQKTMLRQQAGHLRSGMKKSSLLIGINAQKLSVTLPFTRIIHYTIRMFSTPTPVNPGESRTIPLFSQSVRAGFPSPAADYAESGLDFNELLINNAATTFVVRAEGESMLGAGIFPGDFLVVDRSLVARKEDIVIAALDGEFTVKRLKHRDGRFILAPENPAYPVIRVDEASELSIWGVVTFVLHGLRAARRQR